MERGVGAIAQKVVVELVDDLDGIVSEDISTVTFGLDEVEYEFYLGEDNAARLRDSLAHFIAAARRTGGRIKRDRSAARPAADWEQTRAIRDWARDHGYELAEHGRIPSTVIAANEEAQAAAAKPKGRRGWRKAEPAAS